ncbi:intestinal mucin-like protein [Morone saxatilis]|uniref:intestinal mucin-like protein n=1 Tax=Morone saxatilis TaxID=34816 RepID=UPI0015E1CCCE|nr:intestinal mucin-like protein [Morone saxatilis]
MVHCFPLDGEVWKEGKCTLAKCINGKVTRNQTSCPTPKPVVCANNFHAVEVTDDDGCCSHYECQCVCYGWGDPHYVTFDGTYYGFQGNCSYWLVKEILPRYNFSVMIDNYYCGAADGLSCPQSITVFYQNYKIFITQKDINGDFINQISVNDKAVSPAYQNGDFRLTTTGIDTVLLIPKIHAKITFSGLIFSIYLPFSQFGGNTVGQCGTCDNNRTDDCMLPNGKIDPSCPHMAHEWHANNSYCNRVPPTPPPTTTPTPCNTTVCEIMKSSVFEACHKVVDYSPFVVACEFDICHMHINHIGCTSLQTYADACAESGVCIDWRSATNGLCEFKCPSPKVYEACGPLVEPTCDSWYNEKFIYAVDQFSAMMNVKLEGCYCPNGTYLLSSSINECVPSCEICRLPNGKWTKANTTWTDGCDECICEEDTLQVTCRPLSCPTEPPVSCDQEGQVKVTDTVGCCQKERCECDMKLCPESVASCPIGYTLTITKGVCCVNYTCEMKDVCVLNNHEYQIGEKVPMKPCETCVCTNKPDTGSSLHQIDCEPVPCDKFCPLF